MTKLRNVKNMLADESYAKRIKDIAESGKRDGWEHWWGGYPVPKELILFMDKLEKLMPNCRFYPAEIGRHYNDAYIKVSFIIDEFSVIMDNNPFDLGRVGYKSYAVRKNSEVKPSYGIYSRKINNPKYSPGRDQNNMVMSYDVDKAVKNASKYLVPYTTKELATAFYKNIHARVSEVLQEKQEKAIDVLRPISNDKNTIRKEMMHLMSLGITFKTDAFKKAAESLRETYEEYVEEQKRKVQGVFVRVRTMGEDTYIDVQEVDDVRENSIEPRITTPQITYLLSEAPEDIAGSISVLSILVDTQYVPRVGMKIDENNFYIERA